MNSVRNETMCISDTVIWHSTLYMVRNYFVKLVYKWDATATVLWMGERALLYNPRLSNFVFVKADNCNFQDALKVLARWLGNSGKCLCSKYGLVTTQKRYNSQHHQHSSALLTSSLTTSRTQLSYRNIVQGDKRTVCRIR